MPSEIPGRFWLPAKAGADEVSADKWIPGLLHIGEKGVEVQLFGSLSPRHPVRDPARYLLVHGWLHRSPPGPYLKGTAVTLVRSFVSQLSWSMSAPQASQLETLTANEAFVGDIQIDPAKKR